MTRIKAVVVLWLLVSPAALAQPRNADALRAELTRILQTHETATRTTVTCKVIDLRTERVLFEHGGGRLLVPASNLKIYTAACALDTFEPALTFTTRLLAKGEIQSAELKGDLILIGGGDAMLTSAELRELAGRVVDELKISRVNGRVLVDNSRYASSLKGPGWMWDDDPDDYNMSITPLMIDFNVLTVRLTPQGDQVNATLVPASPVPSIQLVDRSSYPAGPRATRLPFTDTILIADRGALEETEEIKLTMHDPGPWVAAMFQQMLIERGVRFTAGTNYPQVGGQDPVGLVHKGVDLTTTLNHFHEVSENAVGEVLLHEIAIARGIKRPRWQDGARVVTNWLVEEAGLTRDSFRYVDGSGLSRYNLISADSAVTLLSFLDKHRHAKIFCDSLPKYEVDLSGIEWPETDHSSRLEPSRVSAKGGSMSGVSTCSGYLTTLSNRRLAFSILANGFIGSATPVRGLRAQLWRALVTYSPDS